MNYLNFKDFDKKKKIPKVIAGSHACCIPGMLTRRCTGAGRVLASGRTKRPFK